MVTVNVANGEFFFTPSSVTIHTCDSVLWTWSSSGHSSTSGSPGTPSGLWTLEFSTRELFSCTRSTPLGRSHITALARGMLWYGRHGYCLEFDADSFTDGHANPTPAVTARLGNISTSGLVKTGSDVMIGGFIFKGAERRQSLCVQLVPS